MRGKAALGERLLFRGHSNKSFSASPSVFRTPEWAQAEDKMLKQLLARHPNDFERDRTALEKMVRAQHYGLPTRLLDVTRNPLVALYFACSSNKQNETREATGEVIVFSPSSKRQKYFDSDTISCLTNLGFLSSEQRESLQAHLLKTYEEAFVAFPADKDEFQKRWADLFNDAEKNENILRLSQLVSQERPGFHPKINPRDLANVYAVVPRILNKRIAAQDGEFLVYGFDLSPEDHFFVESIELQEVYISGSKKTQILEELRALVISHENLFPEISNSADFIKSSFAKK
ncbi:FRG domain-containing protein [Pelagimonas sp. KU-00592-HH]|uniref:FRG domain-containing protein n=1 Tax=Pelagimonas sp. KU-00592-HH TaxID=3127651 RepID=UPI003342334D